MFSLLVGERGRSCPLCSATSVSASANCRLFFLYFIRCGGVTPNLSFGYTLKSQETVLADRVLRDTQSILLPQGGISNTYVTPYTFIQLAFKFLQH